MIGNYIADSSWELQRLGKITSSKCSVLFTDPKSKADKEAGALAATTRSYLMENVAEMLTGQFRSLEGIYALKYGHDQEPYAFEKLGKVYPTMEFFGGENQLFLPLTDFSGGSPDSADWDNRLVGEIKCPENPVNHLENLLLQDEADFEAAHYDYWCQLQMNMMCVAKKLNVDYMSMKGIFVSYSPSFDEALQLKIIEVKPKYFFNMELLTKIEKGTQFMKEVVLKIKKNAERKKTESTQTA